MKHFYSKANKYVNALLACKSFNLEIMERSKIFIEVHAHSDIHQKYPVSLLQQNLTGSYYSQDHKLIRRETLLSCTIL